MSRRYGRLPGLLRLTSVWTGLALLAWYARPTPPSVSLGSVLCALGAALRVWAAGHLRKTDELVTAGPYRYTRNPLYLGRLLIFTGLCVMAVLPHGAHWLVLLLGYAVFFGYYLPRKERVEPARLHAIHGAAFERYRRAVPALFPAWHAYVGSTPGGWSSDRLLRNREHWMLAGLLGWTMFMLWRAYTSGP